MYETQNRRLYFYFDYVSPNAYLSWTQLSSLADHYPLEIVPIPILFAGLLKHNNQLGPAEIAAKRRWMYLDVLRKARRLQVPLNPPPVHPFNPLLALRITCMEQDRAIRDRLITAFFSAAWVSSLDISCEHSVADILNRLQLDSERLIQKSKQPSSKQALFNNTQDAIAKQVFGVPTYVVDQRLFWGFDDLDHLQLYLSGKDPLDDQELTPWHNLPAVSRHRPRR